jgi:hypothetical protein
MSLSLPTTVKGFHDDFKLTADPRSKESMEPLSWLGELEGRLTYALRHLTFDTETARRVYGAVSYGKVWRFGCLDRKHKKLPRT